MVAILGMLLSKLELYFPGVIPHAIVVSVVVNSNHKIVFTACYSSHTKSKPLCAVQGILKKKEETDCVEDKSRSGRPGGTSKREDMLPVRLSFEKSKSIF